MHLSKLMWMIHQVRDCVSKVSATTIVHFPATPCGIVQLRIRQFSQPCRMLWQHRILLLAQPTPGLFVLPYPDDLSVCYGMLLVFNAFRLTARIYGAGCQPSSPQ